MVEIKDFSNWFFDCQLLCGSITFVFLKLKALRSLLYDSKDTFPHWLMFIALLSDKKRNG